MADKIIAVKLEADTGGAVTNVKAFREQLKQAQQDVIILSEKFGATSKEATAAAQKAAGLKDAIGDAKDLVNAFNPDTKFRAFGASINTVVGGFTALQGIMGLVGIESEETQKALLKVQSALAISQGIAQLQEGVRTFKNLGAVIQATTIFQKANAAATAIAATVMRAFGASAVTSATGFKILKVAIAATGIGLLVVGLGLLIPKIIEWVSSTNNAALSQDALNESVERLNESLDKNLNKIEFSTKKRLLLAETAGKSEADIQKIREEGLRKELTQLTVSANTKAALANRAIAENVLEVSELNKIRDDALSAEAARQKKFEELQLSGLQFQATTAKKQRDESKAAAEKVAAENEAAKKEQLAEAESELRRNQANFTATGGPAGGLNIQIPKTTEQLQIEQEAAARRTARLEEQQLQEYAAESYVKFTEIHTRNVQERINNEQAEYQNRLSLTNASINVLGALAEVFGKQTVAGKILAIAQIATGTAVAFIQGLDIAQKSAKGTGPAAAFAFPIFYATQIAAILGAVARAKAALGGSGPNVSSPTLPTSAPLQPVRAQQQTTTLDQESLDKIGNATVRAFVLESDITNNQERVRRLNRAARLGG